MAIAVSAQLVLITVNKIGIGMLVDQLGVFK